MKVTFTLGIGFPGAEHKEIGGNGLQTTSTAAISERKTKMTIATIPNVAPRRIAVDFDGTIADTDFPTIKGVKPGAREALKMFRRLGFQVVVWSCRTCHWDYNVYGGSPEEPTLDRERVKEMIAFLDANGLEYDEIDDGSRGKPGADYYIDDKGVRFMDNWDEIMVGVMNRELFTQDIPERLAATGYELAPNKAIPLTTGEIAA